MSLKNITDYGSSLEIFKSIESILNRSPITSRDLDAAAELAGSLKDSLNSLSKWRKLDEESRSQ
jgi:hypothetical protein